jgi:hypothetical protein
MQAPREQTLEHILERVERRESQARRRALLYTLVPIVMASILLVYTSVRIHKETRHIQTLQQEKAQYSEQIDALKSQSAQYASEVKTLQERIDSLKKELEDSEARLKKAVELSQYTHAVDFVDLKSIFSRNPREARALELILSLRQRNVGWRLGGQTPAQGFDSPSFAMFILHELRLSTGLVQPGESLLEASRRLFERLKSIPEPGVGNLVFYPAGYVLFYFKDGQNNPFVIGMTPMGITALKPNFATPIGYRRSGL